MRVKVVNSDKKLRQTEEWLYKLHTDYVRYICMANTNTVCVCYVQKGTRNSNAGYVRYTQKSMTKTNTAYVRYTQKRGRL